MMYDNLLKALEIGLGDAEAAQIMLDDLIEQNRKKPAIGLEEPEVISISSAFFWTRTSQGWDYWNGVNDIILDQETD